MKRFAFCLAALLLPLSSLAQRNVEAEQACLAKPSHAVLAAGGNGAGDRRLLCEIELDQRRMRDLTATAASLR